MYSYKFNVELQSQHDTMSRLWEGSRKIWSNYDELRLWYDDKVYNGRKIGERTPGYQDRGPYQGIQNGDCGTRRLTITDRGSALSSP